MGGSGSSQSQPPQVTNTSMVQNKDPWAPAGGYLLDTMAKAQSLQNSGVGYQTWQGPTQAGIDPRLQYGLDSAYNMAAGENGGTPGVNATSNFLLGQVQNQGLSPEMQNYILPGMKQMVTEAQGNQNPYLQDILNTQGRQIADKVNASMSGAGRYGSGAHTDVMTRALAESANPLLAQDYENRQQRLQGLYRDIDTIYTGGLGRAMQAGAMIPGMDQARYANADRLMGIGQFYQQRAQNDLNNQINNWNIGQTGPWDNLARYNAIISGAGALGGSSVSTGYGSVQNPSVAPPLSSRILGGAAVGAGLGSAIPGIGTGLGALGGAGLGYFMG